MVCSWNSAKVTLIHLLLIDALLMDAPSMKILPSLSESNSSYSLSDPDGLSPWLPSDPDFLLAPDPPESFTYDPSRIASIFMLIDRLI